MCSVRIKEQRSDTDKKATKIRCWTHTLDLNYVPAEFGHSNLVVAVGRPSNRERVIVFVPFVWNTVEILNLIPYRSTVLGSFTSAAYVSSKQKKLQGPGLISLTLLLAGFPGVDVEWRRL